MANKSVKAMVEELTGPEAIAKFQEAFEAIIVNEVLGDNESSALRTIQAMVKEQVVEPAQGVINYFNNDDDAFQLYDAYCDVVSYGTPVAQAAADSKIDAADLAWLIGKRPVEGLDKDDYEVSRDLKKVREPKKEKAPKEKKEKAEKAEKKGKGKKAKKAKKVVEEDDADDDDSEDGDDE